MIQNIFKRKLSYININKDVSDQIFKSLRTKLRSWDIGFEINSTNGKLLTEQHPNNKTQKTNKIAVKKIDNIFL